MPRSVGRAANGSTPPRYVYVSPSGPGTLVTHAPTLHRRVLEARIKMAAAGAAGLTGSVRSRTSFARAAVLTGYLERRRQWVGTLARPRLYVRGAAQLRHGVLRDYVAELAVFAGVVGGLKLALIGSPDGLLDEVWEAKTDHGLDYYLLEYMRHDAHTARVSSKQWVGPWYEAAVDDMLKPGVLPSNGVRMEFLAKPLFQSNGVLVATPVFVSA
ncbi:DUF7019 family protein [Streptomyces griseobrunneus]